MSIPVMAEKQSSENAVEQLIEGSLDPNTLRAREISDAVAERVLKNVADPKPAH